MPAFDKTGPRGLGRMTGRRFGSCTAETAKSESTEEGAVKSDLENVPAEEVVYGLGRGGVPRGCGQGFGGGRNGGCRGNPRR